MKESILSSVLDVCQNIFDSQFSGVMAGSQFGTSGTGCPGGGRMRRSDLESELVCRDSAADVGTDHRYIFSMHGVK
jgi:hypothetical protein